MKLITKIIICSVIALSCVTSASAEEKPMKYSYGVNGSVDLRASTTLNSKNVKIINKDIKDIHQEVKGDMRDLRASSTMMFKDMKNVRREIMKKMKLNAFEIRKNALIRELTLSLNNLMSIRGRINERIIKSESSGRSMTEAKALLIVADEKLAKAKIALKALVDFKQTGISSNTNASTTVEVDLEKPRKIGDEAIKAIKEAKESLRKVVNAIAHAMGLGNTATSTATSTKVRAGADVEVEN